MSTLELPNGFTPTGFPMWISSIDVDSGRYFATLLIGYRTYPGGRIENVIFAGGANIAMTSLLLGANPTIELHLSRTTSFARIGEWLSNRRILGGPTIDVLEEFYRRRPDDAPTTGRTE